MHWHPICCGLHLRLQPAAGLFHHIWAVIVQCSQVRHKGETSSQNWTSYTFQHEQLQLRLEEQEIFIFAGYHNLHCLFVVLLAVSKPSKDKKFLTLGASLDTGVTSSKASFIKLLTKRSATVTNTLPFSTICHEKQFRDWITTLP